MPPGGSVVSWTSTDSPVASFPFRTPRISAPVAALCGASFSKGNVAEGRPLSSSAAAVTGKIEGINTAGSAAHNSRRVTDMLFLLICLQIRTKVYQDEVNDKRRRSL